MTTRVEAALNKDMAVELTPVATGLLARRGWEPVMGARPLRRTIQREIEDQLSEKLLFGEVTPDEIDLRAERVEVYVDGKLQYSGTGEDVQGHPGEALALAANGLARRGRAIEAGWVVLTGGITDAVFAPPGSTVEVMFSSLGGITIEGGDKSV